MQERGLLVDRSERVFVDDHRADMFISLLFVGVLLCAGVLIVAVLGRPTLVYESDQTGEKPSIGGCALGGIAVMGGLLLAGIAWSSGRRLWSVIGFIATAAAFLWTARYAGDFADDLMLNSSRTGDYKVLDLGSLGAIHDVALTGALLTAVLLIINVLPLVRGVFAPNDN